MLHITQTKNENNSIITLNLTGTINFATVGQLRETAFAALGTRPNYLFLDLRSIPLVENYGIQTLVTISSVARMVNVQCVVLPSPALEKTLVETGMDSKIRLVDASFVPMPLPRNTALAEPGRGRPSRKTLNDRYRGTGSGKSLMDYV